MPKVSVIIPTYNRAKYLPEAIESVLNQAYKNFEIIVIDDGSTDYTREIVETQRHKDTKTHVDIKYIYQMNKGPGAARNRGIKEAKGEYIAFLDSDDIWLPDKLNVQMEFFERNKVFDAVFSDIVEFNNSNIVSRSFKRSYFDYKNIFDSLLYSNRIPFLTLLVRKDILFRIGLFDESLKTCEDWDLLLRIAYGYKIGFLDVAVGKKRLHATNISENKERMFLDTIKVMQKVSKFPFLSRRQNKRIRAKLRETCFDLGYLYFSKSELLLARDFFAKALQNAYLLDLGAMFYWIATFLSLSSFLRLKKIKQAFNL